MGLVSQEFHLIPGATALDNAMIKLPVLGFSLREARARTLPWLERVGSGARAEHTPGAALHGRAPTGHDRARLVGGTGLLLADEPTGNLDSARTKEILEAAARDLSRARDCRVCLSRTTPTRSPSSTGCTRCATGVLYERPARAKARPARNVGAHAGTGELERSRDDDTRAGG